MNNAQDCTELQTVPANRTPHLQHVLATLKVWRRRHIARSRLRREILEMDVDRTEKDVGLPTGELRREAAKPFWKP